ncbi:MAG: GAF domain-containing protein [Clostridia bacterium]|nr:GAF domain-containing protein [Clostridia bacterium]
MMDYKVLNGQLKSLTEGVPHRVANLANAAALLYGALENINWAGFYIAEGEKLTLGPFQGKPACIEIPFGKGVCGTAAAEKHTVVVDDVHEFPGHIACDGASLSEIVVPIFRGETVVAVLDIDSPLKGRFTSFDAKGLEEFARTVENFWN